MFRLPSLSITACGVPLSPNALGGYSSRPFHIEYCCRLDSPVEQPSLVKQLSHRQNTSSCPRISNDGVAAFIAIGYRRFDGDPLPLLFTAARGAKPDAAPNHESSSSSFSLSPNTEAYPPCSAIRFAPCASACVCVPWSSPPPPPIPDPFPSWPRPPLITTSITRL